VASVTSNLADADQAIGDLDSVKSIALYSLAGAVGAAVVILFLVMVMIVRERKREIGILKAIGASNGRIMAQFTTEAVTFALLGLVVGAVVGIIAASPVTSALVSNSGASSATGGADLSGAPGPFLSHLTDINAQAGWGVILAGLAAAVVVAVLASAAAAWMIGRIQPAEALRSE
jgi:putative ABC transport system permease protein